MNDTAPRRSGGLLAAALLLHAWGVWRLWFVCDDAFISFRYARNAAAGHGFRYNLGPETPVEGYSNFLWTALAAVVEWVGGDVTVWMPCVSALCGAWLVVAVYRAALGLGLGAEGAGVAAVTLAASPVVAAWSTGGLATMPMALLMFLMVDRLVLRRDAALAPTLAVVAALVLIRTEGVAWAAVIAVLAFGAGWWSGDRRAQGRAGVALAVALVVLGAHLGWRLSTYDDVVANTARAKVHLSADTLLRGGKYVAGVWVALWVPALALLGAPALAARGPRGVVGALMAVAVPVWCVVVGGDYMAFGRLLLAGLPFATLCGAAGVVWLIGRVGRVPTLAAWAALVVVGALPGLGVDVTPRSVRDAFFVRATTPWIHSEHGMWRMMSRNAQAWRVEGLALRAVGRPEATLVTGAIGARGYYSGLTILDRGGLVTKGLEDHAGKAAASRRSPGHDVIAPREAFLPLEPTWLRFSVQSDAPLELRTAKELRSWRVTPSLRERYAPRVYPVRVDGQDLHVLVLERAADPEQAAAWWGEQRDAESSD